MKRPKLIIHLGYPKTATTTIQEELFFKAHQHGVINYLGCLRFSKTIDFKDYSGNFRKAFLSNNLKPFEQLKHILEKDKFNVLSDEKFLLPSFYLKLQHGSFVNLFSYLEEFIFLLRNDIDIQFLITIRNQSDLIFSQFVQKFHLLSNHLNIKTYSEFLVYFDKNKDDFEDYNYQKLNDNLTRIIHKDNIHFVLFENLVNLNPKTTQHLSSLLNIEEEKVKQAFISNYRKRKQESGKIVIPIQQSIVPKIYNKYNFTSNSIFHKLKNKMFYTKKHEISRPTQEQEAFIRNHFLLSNVAFFKVVSIPELEALSSKYISNT